MRACEIEIRKLLPAFTHVAQVDSMCCQFMIAIILTQQSTYVPLRQAACQLAERQATTGADVMTGLFATTMKKGVFGLFG